MTCECASRGKILVVDSDPKATGWMSAVLATSGYEVIICADAESGLHAARVARPILICVEASAAPRAGSNLYAALKDDPLLQHVPVVVLGTPQRVCRSGVRPIHVPNPDACVPRALAPQMLLATVHHVLQARLSIN